MAPTYRISAPDVLATLPRPLSQSKGQYHAGEVYTQQPGSKKRKRLEIAVGVDGEAANIYHVPSSDLRTSYPIPPQESFTSPPYSIRYQKPKSADREQYTYFSTRNGAESKITLCKDVISSTGRTASTNKSRRIQHKSNIIRLFTSHDLVAGDDASAASHADLIAVCQDGQIMQMNGSDLEEKWSASTLGLCKELLPNSPSAITVEECFQVTAEEALNGIFQGRQDAFGAFGRTIDAEAFDPDVLIIVARIGASTASSPASRALIVLGTSTRTQASAPSLVQLHVAPLPSPEEAKEAGPSQFQLHIRSAQLRQLSGGTISNYDLTSAVPKLRDTVAVAEGSTSFVQLSEHSVLSFSPSALTVTNIAYRSVQAQVAAAEDAEDNLTFLTYLSKLDLVIGITNNSLYSIQVQRHKSSSKEGLLIDAIGCGLSKAEHLPNYKSHHARPPFNKLLPGTLSDRYVNQSLEDVKDLDAAMAQNNTPEFERLLAAKFQVEIEKPGEGAPEDHVPSWRWLETPPYPFVDRRWVLYAISRVFEMELGDADSGRVTLERALPQSNVLQYLVVAGHLTVANVLAAFRSELSDAKVSKNAVAEVLVQQLIEDDETLNLLLNYLMATKLGEVELLLILRTIMRSLDQRPQLAPAKSEATDVADEDYVAMEIDTLERAVEKGEFKLGDDSATVSGLLTEAFERLTGYSSVATVRAMRVTLSPVEILSLIHLLRVLLVGGAWTTKYSETLALDQDEFLKMMPDGTIALISELLARCIDAVGTNGWLTSGSGADQLDGGHFLSALKLEVNAALEGLNEAVTLSGVLGEAVRYGSASLEAGHVAVAAARNGDRPVQLEVAGAAELPLGLAPKQAVTQFKVVSGGEVIERSAREKGHLLSQQVKEYSLERISV